MHNFGATIYLDKMSNDEIKNYLDLLNFYKIKIISTSLINMPLKDDNFIKKLKVLINQAKINNQEVWVDLNATFFYDFNLVTKKPKEVVKWFLNLGLTGIRCNEDISLKVQAQLTAYNYNFKIILNGTKSMFELDRLIVSHNLNPNNTISCYNFYPQINTGASCDFYLLNQYESHANNIMFAGFVSSNKINKEAEGNAPSLEIHRDWDLISQIRHLIALNTDIVIINQPLSKEELEKIINIQSEKVSLKIKLLPTTSASEKNIIFDKNYHFVRCDLSENVIRSCKVKEYYQEKILAKKETKQMFEVGDVIIINENSKNYHKELQIVIKPFKSDATRNLVGKIEEPYLSFFLKELKANRTFIFVNE